eukprot:m.128628 g.128628  ORF g.128628 m.128628 type:complete len:175 (-) comp13875_c1_seq1:280-804(-)
MVMSRYQTHARASAIAEQTVFFLFPLLFFSLAPCLLLLPFEVPCGSWPYNMPLAIVLRCRFNADTSANMQWKFRPQQKEVKLVPGETALAFYTATNPTDKAVTGISTYNVVPYEAGLYFNKIQCFCFEEQRLNPNESVDMPVFFYIDPEFAEDPNLVDVDDITLSYTFFKAREQ